MKYIIISPNDMIEMIADIKKIDFLPRMTKPIS
jgi:hypothetical protein